MKTRYILQIPVNKLNTKKAKELLEYNLDGQECYYKVSVKGKYWCFSESPSGFTINDSWLTEIKGQVKTASQAWDDEFAGKSTNFMDPISFFKKGWELANENVRTITKEN